jgi:hypothetical protein
MSENDKARAELARLLGELMKRQPVPTIAEITLHLKAQTAHDDELQMRVMAFWAQGMAKFAAGV